MDACSTTWKCIRVALFLLCRFTLSSYWFRLVGVKASVESGTTRRVVYHPMYHVGHSSTDLKDPAVLVMSVPSFSLAGKLAWKHIH